MLNKYYLKEYIDNSDCNAPDDIVYWLVKKLPILHWQFLEVLKITRENTKRILLIVPFGMVLQKMHHYIVSKEI